MPDEIDSLREQFLLLMADAPMSDYSADPSVYARIGKLFADQSTKQIDFRRFGLKLVS